MLSNLLYVQLYRYFCFFFSTLFLFFFCILFLFFCFFFCTCLFFLLFMNLGFLFCSFVYLIFYTLMPAQCNSHLRFLLNIMLFKVFVTVLSQPWTHQFVRIVTLLLYFSRGSDRMEIVLQLLSLKIFSISSLVNIFFLSCVFVFLHSSNSAI